MMVLWGILTAILVLLLIPVRLLISSSTEQGGRAVLRYPFVSVTLYPKPKKKGKAKDAKPRAKEKPRKPKEEKPKRDMTALLPQLATDWKRLSAPVQRLLRRTALAKFSFEMVVVGEDAAATALRYGTLNAVAFSTVAILDSIVTLRMKHLVLIPGFAAEQEQYVLSGELRVVPAAVLIAAVQLGFWTLIAFVRASSTGKNKQENRRSNAAEGKGEYHGEQTPHQ